MSVWLKICGLTRREDLECCRDAGVDAVGINLWPGSSRHMTADHAARLLAGFERGPLKVVGVFVDPSPHDVAAARESLALDYVQLHGYRGPAEYPPALGPFVEVLRGEVPAGFSPHERSEYVLFDAAVAGFGGAGVTADWSVAAQLVRQCPRPVVLAGGLSPENIADARARVAPAGVDVASGAEVPGAPGVKDETRIRALVSACKS